MIRKKLSRFLSGVVFIAVGVVGAGCGEIEQLGSPQAEVFEGRLFTIVEDDFTEQVQVKRHLLETE